MADLSPAAQAVLDAFTADNYGVYLEGDPDRIAAALRAATNQVVPEEPRWTQERRPHDFSKWREREIIRRAFLAIATELEQKI